MIIKLDDFEIANGDDRTARVLGEESVTLQQRTQVETPCRAAWPVAFPDRAVRSIPLSYDVTFPPCASLEAALLQSRTIATTCPKGGILTEQHGEQLITYAAAWITSIQVRRMGVTNQFTFSLEATEPTTATLSPIAQMDPRYPNILSLTGLTGGAAGDLDAQITTDVAVGRYVDFDLLVSGDRIPHRWKLCTWTDETEDAAAGRVLPDDFDSTTNPKFWLRLI